MVDRKLPPLNDINASPLNEKRAQNSFINNNLFSLRVSSKRFFKVICVSKHFRGRVSLFSISRLDHFGATSHMVGDSSLLREFFFEKKEVQQAEQGREVLLLWGGECVRVKQREIK